MKIIVGYRMSPAGDAALEAGIREAKLRNADLVIMHSSKGRGAESAQDIEAIEEAAMKVSHRLKGEGVTYTLHEYVLGNTPAQDIARAAEEEGAELIVIGLRKRSLTGKLLLGSNAHDVLMTAPCPVLAVRADY